MGKWQIIDSQLQTNTDMCRGQPMDCHSPITFLSLACHFLVKCFSKFTCSWNGKEVNANLSSHRCSIQEWFNFDEAECGSTIDQTVSLAVDACWIRRSHSECSPSLRLAYGTPNVHHFWYCFCRRHHDLRRGHQWQRGVREVRVSLRYLTVYKFSTVPFWLVRFYYYIQINFDSSV